MVNTVEYAVSKGFNKNIFIERDEAGVNEYDVSKFGMEFFPGNEILVPGAPDVPPTPVSNPYLTFSSEEPFTLLLNESSTPTWDGVIEYSIDTKNWTTWDGSEISSGSDNKLYLRGTGNSVITNGNAEWKPRFTLSGSNISCVGNIETLLDYQTVMNGEHPIMGTGCFHSLFMDDSNLISAPELLATTLARDCYNSMFRGCTVLTTAPELSATALARSCYSAMFYGCTSLVTAPELPAATLASDCYVSMFNGCTSLTVAPELPAITLAERCYGSMFNGCTSLTTPPELPVTALAEGCYQNMFNGCTSLTTVPELLATTLANNCYSSMFTGCTSIKLSETQDSDYTTPYRIPKEGIGTDVTKALTSMFKNTGGTFTGTPAINTTYYLHKDNSIV